MNNSITIIIEAGEDGGRAVYVSSQDEHGVYASRFVFGGDVEQSNKYIAERNAKLDNANAAPAEPLQIEAPKIRVRKPKPTQDALDALDALEAVEEGVI